MTQHEQIEINALVADMSSVQILFDLVTELDMSQRQAAAVYSVAAIALDVSLANLSKLCSGTPS